MPYAHMEDCALYYELRGEAGTPLLLIAGYGASIASWYPPLIERLAACHRVILFDNRGAGHSGKPNHPYSMADFVADTVTVLDTVGVDAAHVMGVSMGGMIAQNFALRHPERVRGLILGATLPASPKSTSVTPPEESVLNKLVAPRSGDPAEDIRNLWPILYSARFMAQERELLEEMLQDKAVYPSSPQYALECQMHAVSETHDVLDRLCDIRRPTLVLTGTEDVLIPAQNSRLIAEAIPNARLVEYAGAGHGFLDEVAKQATGDILRFLAEVDASYGPDYNR